MAQPTYSITYDFGDESGVTGWILYEDGIVLSKHPTWEEANAKRERLKGAAEQ